MAFEPLWEHIAHLGLENYLYSLESSTIKNDKIYILNFIPNDKYKPRNTQDRILKPFWACIKAFTKSDYVHTGICFDDTVKSYFHVSWKGIIETERGKDDYAILC